MAAQSTQDDERLSHDGHAILTIGEPEAHPNIHHHVALLEDHFPEIAHMAQSLSSMLEERSLGSNWNATTREAAGLLLHGVQALPKARS
jgi:hypothetical protein